YSIEDKLWHVYDPNFKNGIKKIPEEYLALQIENCLGKFISIAGSGYTVNPGIDNIDEFIKDGGLITLFKGDLDANSTNQLLAILDNHYFFSQDTLQGLLIRGTSGGPAWKIGLSNSDPRLQNFTKQLLLQFQAQNPDNYAHHLADSIADLSDMEHLSFMETVISSQSNS